MKAAVCRRYGPPDAVTAGDVPKPVPGGGEVLVRVHAATAAWWTASRAGAPLPTPGSMSA